MFDIFEHKYPYQNAHELNLDWFLSQFKPLLEEYKNIGEALQEFYKKFDSELSDTIKSELNKMYEDGILSQLIGSYVDRNRLVDTANVSIYAQAFANLTDSTGYSAQGMAIGTINGIDYMLSCFTGANNCICTINNMASGAEIVRGSLNAGHCNSATFNPTNEHFYIACGGGNNGTDTIIETDTDLAIIHEYTFTTGTQPYGIAYNNGLFYVLCSGRRINVYNPEFELVETLNFLQNTDTTYQGLEVDDTYIYIPNGNGFTNYTKIVGSFVDVFTKTGSFVKKIYVNCVYEQEDIAIHNGIAYMNFSTGGLSLICKSTLRESINTFTTSGDYYKMGAVISGYVKTIYVDETYKSFLSDGSQLKPLNSLYHALLSGADQYVETLKIELMSDTVKNINIKNHINKVNIDCHNHKVKGVLLLNNNNVTIQNAEIYDRNDTYNSMFETRGCKYVYLNNIKFTTNVCDYCLKVNSSTVKADNITFNVSANQYMMIEQEAGYIFITNPVVNVSEFTYNLFNPMSRIGGSVSPSLFTSSKRDGSGLCKPNMITYISDTTTFDFATINKANVYQFTVNQTFVNSPVLTSSEHIDCAVYTFIGDKRMIIDLYVVTGTAITKHYKAYKYENTLTAWVEV